MKKYVFIVLLLLMPAAFVARAEDYVVSRLDQGVGLSDNSVNALVSDSRGFLWVGTNDGLDFYDGSNFVKVPFSDEEGAVRPVVFTLAEDPSGVIWAGTSEGLFRLGKDGGGMQAFPIQDMGRTSIRQMCCSESGFLWIAYRGGKMTRIDTRTGEISRLPQICHAVCSSTSGAVYAVSNHDGLLMSSDGSSDLTVLIPNIIDGKDISRIARAGSYLFLINGSGATRVLDLRTNEINALPYANRLRDVLLLKGKFILAAREGVHIASSTLELIDVLRPFHDNSFRCLAKGRDGSIWAGTLFEGLALLSQDELQFRHHSSEFSGGSFKARDFVETSDGRIWAGTDTKGLLCISSPGQKYFAGRNVTGLFPEGQKLWVGTIDNELPVALLDTETGRITYYPDAGTSAYAFCRDQDGRLWVGGKDGFIVGKESPDGRFEKDIFIPTLQVSRILLASNGAVWVASISGDVLRYAESAFSTFKVPVSNILTDIAEDASGRILAATEGSGLWEFSKEENSFVQLKEAEPRIFKITREPGGKLLWITGAHGIHIINPDDSKPLPLISRESLDIDRFNYSSNFISSDGTLYAGTSDGFISFRAKKLVEQGSSAAPVVSYCRILSSSDATEGKGFISPSSINLGRNSRSFQVNVSTLDYSLFPAEKIFWKIDGRGDWAPVENGSFTVYDIPSGERKLRIMALSLSGEESDQTVVKIKVSPSLLLSPVAFLLYLLVLGAAMWTIAYIANRRAKIKAELAHERKLFESKMEFLTTIAHEIRTPLSLVQIPLEALIRKFASTPDASVQENLDIMRRNSLKLTVLINELLDFRKLTDSTFQMHPEFLDIRSIVKDAHRRFHPTFLQEGKSLEVKVPDVPVFCETDVRSLGRIFDNLLSNALKYSKSRTSMSLSINGHDAVMSVENDGVVLPEDAREKIFQPFYRHEDKDTAGLEGTGLGLSTSRKFAVLLGGSLSMDDDLNINRFIFTIPITSEAAQPAEPIKVSSKDKSVMVVEDDRDMARLIGEILSDGYDIIYASNGSDALEKIKAGASPSLVVSDIIMPQMDGIELTKSLKSNLATSHIPIVLLSAEVPDTLMQESLEGGADAYLEKPFSPKQLRSTVDNLIENRRRIYEFYVSSLPSDGELPTGRVSAQEQKFLRSIQEYVSANIHRNISLDDLAEVVCLSPSTLYKKMKDYAGISPMEYVMKVRLHRAVELLKDDTMSVQEVAQAVGFNTHSFFSECFKREFGMTPRQWRLRTVAKPQNT